MQPLIVTKEQAGMRLDRLIAAHLGLSRRCARLLISAGRVQLGGRVCRILTRTVNAGTRFAILAEPPAAHAPGQNLGHGAEPALPGRTQHKGGPNASSQLSAPQVLFADRWLIAINKPAGLLSEGDRFGVPCVMDWLGAWLRRQQAMDALWLVHRLDAGTSGVLVLARHRGVAAALSTSFRDRTAKKVYLALVQGVPASSPLCCDGAIARLAGTRHGVHTGGKTALTTLTTLCATSTHALVRAEPRTGRTHQIRVHTSHAGLPIMGDRLYGGPGYSPSSLGQSPAAISAPIARPMLHAASLTLCHPKTLRPISFEAPVPQDFAALQAALGLGH